MKLKILSLILALIAFSSALASAQTVDSSKTSKAVSVFKADDFYGAAATSIPIFVPPGRKGIQPDISLRYSSVSGNGWLGMGWVFDFGYIERSTRKGIPSYTDKDILEISFLGISSLLEKSTTIPNLYYPLTTSIFVKILSRGNYWELYDKEGRKYVFGQTPDSRMEAPKGTSRWALNKIVDSSGNYLTITYYKDSGQIYPLRVDYTGNENTAELPAHKVDFILEDRNEAISNYRGGYLVTTAKRLKEIKTYVSGNLANRYLLEYISSEQTGRSLLSKFTAFGSDDTTRFPPLAFTYQHSNPPEYNNIIYTGANSGNKLWHIRNGFDMYGNTTGILYPPKTTDGGSSSLEGGGRVFWSFASPLGKTGDYWTTSDKGSLSVNLSAKVPFYAWTYVYTETSKTISIPAVSSGNFFFWLNSDQTTPVNPQQINLKAGNNIIEITGYNADNAYTFDLNYALSDNLTRMHSNQFVIPQLSGDFNGDGLTDLASYQSDGSFKVAISQGQSFKPSEFWPVIPGYGFPKYLEDTRNGLSFLLGDFQGSSGRTDIMAVNNISESELAHTVSNAFVDQGSRYGFFTVKGGTPFAADFNNDGVTDVGWQADNTGDILIALSVTYGIWPSSTWLTGFSGKILLGDFNGDGLLDIASYNSSQSKISVALNKGDVFDAPQAWLLNFTTAYELTGVDYNNDGLTDILYYDKTTGQAMVAVCAGNKFLTPKLCLSGFTIRDTDVALQTADFNGDGLSDIYVFNPYTAKSELAYSTPNFVDLLIKTENGTGAELSIQYDSSVNYDNTITAELKSENEYWDFSGSGLPFGVPVIREIDSSDGMGNSYKTKYSYKGGFYDKNDREFRGFNYVSIVDNENNQKEIYFKQDDIFKGRPYKEEYKDSLGNLYLRITNKWGRIGMGNDYGGGTGRFVFMSRRDKYAFDGDAAFKQSYTTSSYDNAYLNSEIIGGDLISTFEGGDQTIARNNQLKYAFISGDSILSRLALVYTCRNTLSYGLAKKQLYYDYNDSFGVALTKGLLTKEKVFTVVKTHSSGYPEASDTYALITSYTYDNYGNLLTTTDPENHTSTITYDTAYHMYPVETKNPLNQINKSAYDPKTGQILSSTDSNNQITTYLYDPLGRITKVIGPLDTDVYPGVIYEYDLSSRPVKITKRYKIAYPSTYAEEYSFYDGLGRLIQTKLQAEDDPVTGQPRQIVKEAVTFNAQGKVKEKYNAYFVPASTLYSNPDTSIPKAAFEYDCLNRLVKTINPDLTQKTIQYSDWTQTKTDENGHQIRSTYDALNRLVKQEEFNDSEIYTTLYTHDLIYYDTTHGYVDRKQFKITDTRGNITEITYDLADRKLKISDPDMGIWNYTYDKAGNLKTQTDAKGQIVSFDYDALNRLTKKAYPDGKSINYYFDDSAKSYCIGRLSYVADLSGRADYYYDKLGRQVKEINTIDGASYTVERAYNAQNQITSLKYPDNETLSYTYNKAGSVKTIQGAAPYVSNVDYSPNGQMLKLQYANGVSTAYAYDPNTSRLTDLKTNNGSLQDLNYRYDASGNISRITDYRNSASQDFGYDNLNRLIQANGAYGNFSYQYDSIGNMIYKEGVSYNYGQFSAERPHALTSGTDGFSAVYDANGNMTSLNSSVLAYDYDNRLTRYAKYESSFSGQSVTIEIPLTKGWNFVSLPLIVDNPAVTAVFSSIAGKYDQLSRYNPTSNKFEYFVVDNPEYTQWTTLETAKGYQVIVSSDCTLRITGRIPNTSYSSSLLTGWQMLGYPSKNRTKVSDALANLIKGTNYDRISKYDKAANTFVDLASTDYLEPGVAYFIRLLKNSTWTVLPKPGVIDLTEFAYNADGSRVKKIINGTATIYIDDLYEKTDSLVTKHIFAGANRVCSVTKDEARGTRDASYYHSDHLGSSSVITDTNGNQVEHYEYTPYGTTAVQDLVSRPSPIVPRNTVRHLYTSKELDSTGLYYYGARYYNPQIGRFITPDPIDYSDEGIRAVGGKNFEVFLKNPQNLNRYTYCLNNPLRYIDPTGYYSWDQTWNWTRDTFQTLGSALNIGLNYGVNTIIPQGSSLYNGLNWISSNIANPIYNTLGQPGYNYGMWMYGEKSFKNLFGAGLDAAWAISGVTGTIKSLAASGASYWRYIGTESNPTYGPTGQVLNKTWLTRGYQPPYSSMTIAKDKLQLPNIPNSFEQVNVPFGRYVAGGRIASKHLDLGAGGGWEYRVGGWYGE